MGDARDGSGVAASRRAGSGGIAGAHDRGGGSAVHRIIDERCVQVLTGHEATINATKIVLDSIDYMVVSASADGTVRVWHAQIDLARKHITRDPWYICTGTFSATALNVPATPAAGQTWGQGHAAAVWATALAAKGGEMASICIGTSAGGIVVLNSDADAQRGAGRLLAASRSTMSRSPSPSPRCCRRPCRPPAASRPGRHLGIDEGFRPATIGWRYGSYPFHGDASAGGRARFAVTSMTLRQITTCSSRRRSTAQRTSATRSSERS